MTPPNLDDDFDDDDDTDDTPAVQSQTPTLHLAPPKDYPPLPAIDLSISDAEVQEDDLNRVNFVIKALGNAWAVAVDVDDYCKMTLATLKALEARRKILNMQWGKLDADGKNAGTGGGDGDPL